MCAADAPAIASPNAALSYTVFHGSRPKCWNTMATPSGGPATGFPCTALEPVLISVRPAMQRSSVVLPHPLGPTMQRISSRLTSSDSWRNATTVPSRNSFDALSMEMTRLFAFNGCSEQLNDPHHTPPPFRGRMTVLRVLPPPERGRVGVGVTDP